MSNDEETIWIVFNGEIYNFQELRARLAAKGHQFRAKSDTEVILHAYEEFGDACVEQLRGMFAFAIWDNRRRRLLLVRDRVGIKPLYYTTHEGAFLFASEIKALLQWPGVPRAIDPVALRQYLRCRYVPGPRTMFQNIYKLQPGHLLTLSLDSGETAVRCYWDLPLDGEVVSVEEASRALRDRLEECIALHLVSDVPLGVFLSGGLDSTTVTGVMSGLAPGAVRSFAVGYPQAGSDDETPFARLAATHFHTDHKELMLDPLTFWQFLPRLVWLMDEPIADPAAIPLYFLAEFARRSVTVILSGEGGDEILAGYGIYPKMLQLERLHRVPGLGLLRPFLRGRKARRYLDWVRLPLHDRYRGVSAVFNNSEVGELLRDHGTTNGVDDYGAAYFARAARLDPLHQMLYFDLKVWLPDDLLMKADRMTMAASLELRVPFLDHELLEWTRRLPSDLKLHGATGKYLLRQTAGDFVPAEILRRPKKGFAVPVKDWFRNHLVEAARQLLVHEADRDALFNPRVVDTLITSHAQGYEDASEALFTLVVLTYWHRLFIAPSRVEAPL